MERDLSNIPIFQRSKKIGEFGSAKSVIPTIIDGQSVIIKTHAFEHRNTFYKNEKEAYLTLQNENFLPKLFYFDDKNYKLCITDVGEDLSLRTNINLEEYQQELLDIVHTMNINYGISHNDLRHKNICIDKDNKLKLIDFDRSTIGPCEKYGGLTIDEIFVTRDFLKD